MPQVTVFLKPETYLAVARVATDNHTTCSAVLRTLAEEEFEEVAAHGKKRSNTR